MLQQRFEDRHEDVHLLVEVDDVYMQTYPLQVLDTILKNDKDHISYWHDEILPHIEESPAEYVSLGLTGLQLYKQGLNENPMATIVVSIPENAERSRKATLYQRLSMKNWGNRCQAPA